MIDRRIAEICERAGARAFFGAGHTRSDIETDLETLLVAIDAAHKRIAGMERVVEAAREQTLFLVDGHRAETGSDARVREWMDPHEVKIMDAIEAMDAAKGGGDDR